MSNNEQPAAAGALSDFAKTSQALFSSGPPAALPASPPQLLDDESAPLNQLRQLFSLHVSVAECISINRNGNQLTIF
jgi:hypothetical protein